MINMYNHNQKGAVTLKNPKQFKHQKKKEKEKNICIGSSATFFKVWSKREGGGGREDIIIRASKEVG